MFDFIVSVYNGMFMFVFILTNVFILFHFFNKLRDVLFGDEEKRTGYILLTGCDSGFGYDTALELNKRNLYVFAACLATEGVERFKQDENFKGMAFIMNITKKEDIDNARNIIEEKVGDEGLWCLLNNAGVPSVGPIEWMSLDDMKRTMDVNLWGTVNVTKVMMPLVKRARGRIINMTSIAGRTSIGYAASYSMTKYALEAFSDSLRYEMKPWGVSVHIIEPGCHRTNIFDVLEKTWKDLWDIQPEEIKAEYGEDFIKDILTISEKTISKYCANPQDVVNAYIHAVLSSRPKLRYVVGMDANTIFMAIATLPTAMGDYLINLLFKPVMPAATKKAK